MTDDEQRLDDDGYEPIMERALTITDLYQLPDVNMDDLLQADNGQGVAWIYPPKLAELVSSGHTLSAIANMLGLSARLLYRYYVKTVPVEDRQEAAAMRADSTRTQMELAMRKLNLNNHKDMKLFLETKYKLLAADDPETYGRKQETKTDINVSQGTTLVIEDNTQPVKITGDIIEGQIVDDEGEYLARRYKEQRQRLLQGQGALPAEVQLEEG